MTSWASHDVGKLLGGQSPTIHHFQGPRVVRKHEEVQGYGGLWGLERRPFRPRLDYSLPNPIKEFSMKQLDKLF
jgi:hypothetical protein